MLIRRNQRTLETLEEKYLTRSSSALADYVFAFYESASERLKSAAASLWLAGQLTGKDPFTSEEGPRILGEFLSGKPPLLTLRGFNASGAGRFVGEDVRSPEIDYEFRKGFESARDGVLYQGKPFYFTTQPKTAATTQLGTVAVLAVPVIGKNRARSGVVEALVSWDAINNRFRDQAHQGVAVSLVDREGDVIFPLLPRAQQRRDSLLVSDFMRFPAPWTRPEQTPRGAVLASIAPVRQPDWGVLVERDRDLAFASVDLMVRDTVIWSAVALAAALLLGLLFARRLSAPIASLAESTHAISEGEYGATVEVAGTAEIADLSESFNRMSASIRTAFDQVRQAAAENRELFLASIRALAEAIDAKDPYTRGHSERVAAYAAPIAAEMGLPPAEVERVRLSALLHDVGKIGVDDRIIRKPTALSEEEFQIMKTHPIKGAAIMAAIPQLADVIPGMKYHHEKYSGGGYPEGLKGEEIPLQARIVTVADTFDAMTTTRPYQQAMETDYVVERIQHYAGVRYDPQVVEAFVRAYEKGHLVPIPVRLALEEPEEPRLVGAL